MTELTTSLVLQEQTYTNQTYKLSDDKIEGFMDGLEALKQAVYKILATEQYEYPVYDFTYGIAWKELIGGKLSMNGAGTLGLTAMIAAYNEGEEWLEQLLEYISGNLDYIKEYFDTRIPLIRANIPDATYLVWLDCRKLNMTDQELKEFMIRKAGLGLNPGSDFTRALSGFMRLNAACPRATLEKALGQLERAVNELAH